MSTITAFRNLMKRTEEGGRAVSLPKSVPAFETQKWEKWIDLLLTWWQDPKLIEDEGITPPSRATIDHAIRVASTLKGSEPAPSTVVPDGDGGVALEWSANSSSMRAEILPTDDVMLYLFTDGRLIHSEKLDA